MQATKGYNPYKPGHCRRVGLAQHRRALPAGQFLRRPRPQRRQHQGAHVRARVRRPRRRYENPAGLTGVWAEENTRASLFDAMQRKETFGTSGPRIQVRLFGGWDLRNDPKLEQKRVWKLCPTGSKTEWVKVAYKGGVPMGGDLRAMPKDEGTIVRRLGGEGPDLRQSRPHPDRQGLDEERAELREGL